MISDDDLSRRSSIVSDDDGSRKSSVVSDDVGSRKASVVSANEAAAPGSEPEAAPVDSAAPVGSAAEGEFEPVTTANLSDNAE